VRVIALHRLYQRTCKHCGYHWTVTRAQAQLTVRQPMDRRMRVRAREAAVGAQLELVEAFRRCAKCGGNRFSERPVTKRRPADPPEG
jgi:predicted nucleic-acid-binding Zn-ribbon protein